MNTYKPRRKHVTGREKYLTKMNSILGTSTRNDQWWREKVDTAGVSAGASAGVEVGYGRQRLGTAQIDEFQRLARASGVSL